MLDKVCAPLQYKLKDRKRVMANLTSLVSSFSQEQVF